MTDLAKLSAPFPPDRVSWRVGSTTSDKKKGMALAYIDARDVMARLDEVCGMTGWQCRYPHANGKTVCEIGIKVEYETENGLRVSEWIWKADGAGDSDVEAEKGALSDAFKRAAVRWGVGRYLYDVASPWVEIEPAGRSFKISDQGLRQLTALLAGSPPSIRTPAPTKVEAPKGIPLTDPTGAVSFYQKASEWLDALQAAMESSDPGPWWVKNKVEAEKIAKAFPQAVKKVREIESLAMAGA